MSALKRSLCATAGGGANGLDAEALAKNIEGDEFAVEQSKGKPKPLRDHLRERVCKVTAF
jgi:hypothetical protein